MKKASFIFGFLAIMIMFVACSKENAVESNPGLSASKTSTLKKGEPVVVTLNNVSAGSTVKWQVVPENSAILTSSGNKAMLQFSQKGNYSVKAITDGVTGNVNFTVGDSIYKDGGKVNPTPESKVYPLTGDQIKLKPSAWGGTDSSYMMFSAITTNKYPGTENYLQAEWERVAGTADYKVTFSGVFVPAYNTSGTKEAACIVFIPDVAQGEHKLEIIVNGKSIKGSFVRKGSAYTFSWTNTGDVQISPLSI